MSVASQIMAFADRMAMIRQNIQAASEGGTEFWPILWTADDEPFDNRVLGQPVTDLDNAFQGGNLFGVPTVQAVLAEFDNYFSKDLSLAKPYWAAYLATVGWRLPYGFGETLVDAQGTTARLAPQLIFPKGVRPANGSDPANSGMHEFGTWAGTGTYASVDGALPAAVGFSPIMIVSQDATPGGSSPIVTAVRQDNTAAAPSTVDLGFTADATQFNQVILGQQAIDTAGALAGQNVVPATTTTQFKASEFVLLVKSDQSVVELAQINTITPGASLTMMSNLINAWSSSDFIFPMYSNVSRKSGTITTQKTLGFYAWCDRIIAL